MHRDSAVRKKNIVEINQTTTKSDAVINTLKKIARHQTLTKLVTAQDKKTEDYIPIKMRHPSTGLVNKVTLKKLPP